MGVAECPGINHIRNCLLVGFPLGQTFAHSFPYRRCPASKVTTNTIFPINTTGFNLGERRLFSR